MSIYVSLFLGPQRFLFCLFCKSFPRVKLSVTQNISYPWKLISAMIYDKNIHFYKYINTYALVKLLFIQYCCNQSFCCNILLHFMQNLFIFAFSVLFWGDNTITFILKMSKMFIFLFYSISFYLIVNFTSFFSPLFSLFSFLVLDLI